MPSSVKLWHETAPGWPLSCRRFDGSHYYQGRRLESEYSIPRSSKGTF